MLRHLLGSIERLLTAALRDERMFLRLLVALSLCTVLGLVAYTMTRLLP